jgi:Uma2 family endonuclease
MSSIEVPTRKRLPLTRAQVKLLVDGGLVTPGTSEFLNGELIEKMPQNQPHVNTTKRTRRILESIFGWEHVGSQAPIRVDDSNDPEPDVFVLQQSTESYLETPEATDCTLVVEVSDSTLFWDRTEKLKLYARAGIPEYWIVDVNNRRLIVHRRPSSEEYLDIHTFTDAESVATLARPESEVAVAELLP